MFPTRLNTSRVELTKIFKTDSFLREQRSQILSFRSERETLVKQAQVYFARAEELIWRRDQLRTTVGDDAPVSKNLETSYRKTVRTPTVETTHVQSAPATSTQTTGTQATSSQTTPQQLPKLDPGLLDRLTDDVIRRVEKRALIERQRRGL